MVLFMAGNLTTRKSNFLPISPFFSIKDTVIMTSIAFDGLYPQTRLFWSEESVKDVREVGDNSGLQDLELYEGLGGPYRKIYSSFTRMIRLVCDKIELCFV